MLRLKLNHVPWILFFMYWETDGWFLLFSIGKQDAEFCYRLSVVYVFPCRELFRNRTECAHIVGISLLWRIVSVLAFTRLSMGLLPNTKNCGLRIRLECRERFPRPRVSDPDMRHGTCVMHVPWCMPGSLTHGFLWSRWWGKRSRHSQRMRNLQFYVSGKRPMDYRSNALVWEAGWYLFPN